MVDQGTWRYTEDTVELVHPMLAALPSTTLLCAACQQQHAFVLLLAPLFQ